MGWWTSYAHASSERKIALQLPVLCATAGNKEDLTQFRTQVSSGLEGEGTGMVRSGPGLGVGMTDIPTGGWVALQSWHLLLLGPQLVLYKVHTM